jgi:hypothetical protein
LVQLLRLVREWKQIQSKGDTALMGGGA